MSSFYGKDFKLGVLGGGQLGRMMLPFANYMDIKISVLDPAENAPCAKLVPDFVQGDFKDYNTVLNFGKDKDLVTIEIENVNTEALKELKKQGVKVCPDPEHLELIKDKGLQKDFYAQQGIASGEYRLIVSKSEIKESDFPVAQKLRTGGYDGKGVQILKSMVDM
ncbi:MAG: 5-(carboxyamino)imidazole ribonucleotide synthase, partial [Flavobacteriales bacterium]|nr:5-(carboxyamino)imidazole ribonucleotide synthase [Flavobacteriales bacterium]